MKFPLTLLSLKSIPSLVLAVSLFSIWIGTSSAENEEEKRALMFERSDFVNLADKEVPEFHKREEITDKQGRAIEGEWVAIDRKSQKVKFRRTDGKEFDIGMAVLAPQDRRYAELETGYLWQIDPLPTPVDLIKEEIIAFDSMDDTHIRLRCVFPNDASVDYAPKFQINLLTDNDRAKIKAKTGREFVILPRPEPDRASPGWKYPSPLFGREVPMFSESYYPGTLKLMFQTYSAHEIVDAVRTHTMNSAFIHEYNQLTFDEAEPEKKAGTKSLTEILEIIGEVPSPNVEEKSIKPIIAKFKLALYEEKVPRDPAEPLRIIRGDRSVLSQPGVPIDGELQAFFYMSQTLHLKSNKAKIPLEALLVNTPYRFSGVGHTINDKNINYPPEQRRKFYWSGAIQPGIEKTFGFKSWQVFFPEKMRNYLRPGQAMRDFFDQLNIELIRHHIRNGMPVYARKKTEESEHIGHGTQLIITGFKVADGKPLMFEVISIKGSIWDSDPDTGEYQISETMIPYSELDTVSVTYLEIP